jgi:hypothetical protein
MFFPSHFACVVCVSSAVGADVARIRTALPTCILWFLVEDRVLGKGDKAYILKQFAEAMPAWSFILMNAASPSAQAGTRRRSA